MTPEPRFRDLVLHHQLLKEPEPKNRSKRAKLIKAAVFRWLLSSSSSKPKRSSTKALNRGSRVTYRPPDTHGYPGGGGVVFSKDPGQLESRSVSVM